jgi:serine/threonine-protein kinase HipA
MMPSKNPKEAFVWIWLPGKTSPVVAGRLVVTTNGIYEFNYGQSYLDSKEAIAIFNDELPLKNGIQYPLTGLSIPGCLRDAAPDAWGRRVIINQIFGRATRDIDIDRLDELTYLLNSGSDRIGALDFQSSADNYAPRLSEGATLEELLSAAEKVEAGEALTPQLGQALLHGSSIGGARPKAQIEETTKKYIAKFSSSTDIFSLVKAEFIAMRLAEKIGLNVATVRLESVMGKDVLLVLRFDRRRRGNLWERRAMVSALTILKLDEMMARYASYVDLAEKIRHQFTAPKATLKELFGRLVFNIICGNTDDHARNHAAFWDGAHLTLTPAYDICPQNRIGNEASQAMKIHGNSSSSQLALAKKSHSSFLLSEKDAKEIIEHQIATVRENWESVCEESKINQVDKNLLANRIFLNPFIFE